MPDNEQDQQQADGSEFRAPSLDQSEQSDFDQDSEGQITSENNNPESTSQEPQEQTEKVGNGVLDVAGVDEPATDTEPKEDWGSPDSRFDSDGFVKSEQTPQELQDKLVSEAVDYKVQGNPTARYNRDELNRFTEWHSVALDNEATVRDLTHEQYRLSSEIEKAESELASTSVHGAHETPEQRSERGERKRVAEEHLDRLKSEDNFLREMLSNMRSRPELGIGSAARWKEQIQHERRRHEAYKDFASKQIHELLNLNPDGLSSLPVEQFVGLVDRRSRLEQDIITANEMSERVDDMIALLRENIVPGRVLDDSDYDDILVIIQEASTMGVDVGSGDSIMILARSTAQDEWRGLIAQTLLDGSFYNIAANSRARADLRKQEVDEFDQRIKAGDFNEQPGNND